MGRTVCACEAVKGVGRAGGLEGQVLTALPAALGAVLGTLLVLGGWAVRGGCILERVVWALGLS